MELENNDYIKIWESGYIVGDNIVADYQGSIDVYDGGISFSKIEFDAKVILWWHQLDIWHKNISLKHSIYRFIGKNKDDSTFSHEVDEIRWFSFSGCKFNGDVYFNLSDNCRIELVDCIFEKEFSINRNPHPQQKNDKNITIEQLVIDSCIFKNNFLIQSCAIQEYRLIDVIYEENVKIFDVKFGEMFKVTEAEDGAWFTNTIFNKSAIFEKVIFDEFIRFQYTTFKGYTLFRDIKFENGLDFDYTNIEKVINFYNIQGLEREESKKLTSQETYRILKYNFEKIGNKIEANNYYMMEMKKYKEGLEKKNFQDKITFYFNETVSNFGQSWIKPLGIYLAFGLMFSGLVYFIFPIKEVGFFKILVDSYNPVSKSIITNYSLGGLIYKVISGLIIYQLVMALKRQTKR